jgi:hypothetical protein
VFVCENTPAPNFVYQKIRPPDKNKSHSLTAGGVPFPPKEQFTTLYAKEMLLNKTAGQPGMTYISVL